MMRCHYWGGSITENIVQAVARDVFMWHVLKVAEVGFKIIIRAHDELVCLLDEGPAEFQLAEIEYIMSTPPPWMPNLPVRAVGHLCKKYSK
jgi:DNA polymerase